MVNPDDGACGAWGGVCANMGCIPSKALLAASHAYASLSHGLEVFGIDIDPKGVTMDYARMQAHRASCVKSSNKGLSQLFHEVPRARRRCDGQIRSPRGRALGRGVDAR